MLGEVGAVGEGLATVAAFVWFGFSHMDLGVELKVRLGAETLQIRNCLNYVDCRFEKETIGQTGIQNILNVELQSILILIVVSAL